MNQRRTTGRRPGAPAQGSPGPGSTSAGARGGLLLAVAVILGIVLLQQFDDGVDTGGQVAAGGNGTTDETVTTIGGLTTIPQSTSTTLSTRPKAEVQVLVTNGAGVRGLAGATSNALRDVGYPTLTPTDAAATERTVVHFIDGYEAEAREVAGALTLPATVVTPLSSPPPVPDIGEAKVVVVLGADVSASTTTAPAAGATTTTRP